MRSLLSIHKYLCQYEVYVDEAAFKLHQPQAYYFTWRDTVAPMMAIPRTAERSTVIFPEPWA